MPINACYARRLCCLQTCIVVVSLSCVAAPCSSKARNLKVERSRYETLQQLVNQGHQPWRLDAPAVAGDLASNLAHSGKNTNAYEMPMTQITETETVAIYMYRVNGTSYYITLQKFQWLLRSAKEWRWMIWVPTRVTILRCEKAR